MGQLPVEYQVGYNTGNDKTPFISSSLQDAATGGAKDQWNSLAYYAQADYDLRAVITCRPRWQPKVLPVSDATRTRE